MCILKKPVLANTNNKGAVHPAHPCSLISALVNHFFVDDSMIHRGYYTSGHFI